MPALTLMKRRAQGVSYEGETFEGMDLSSMLAFGSKWKDCTFINCDLTYADFSTAEFDEVIFIDCEMPLVWFGATKMRHVTFSECRGKHAIFASVTPMDDVRFRDCQLHYSSFADTTVRSLMFKDTNLHGADLRFIDGGANVTYDGAVLWNTSIQLGCQFFNGTFDERSADLFLAMVGRRHPDPEKGKILTEMAGKQAWVLKRLMAGNRLEEVSLPELKEILADVKGEIEKKGDVYEFPGC